MTVQGRTIPGSPEDAVSLCYCAAYRLRFNLEATAVAMTILHRFISRSLPQSFEGTDVKLEVATCLFLASKIGECPRRLRDVINVTHRLASKDTLCLDREYWHSKQQVVHMEQIILRTLAFDLEVSHPFRFLVHFAVFLKCSRRILRKAWGFVVDALLSSECCIDIKPNVVAAAALYISLKVSAFPTQIQETGLRISTSKIQRQATPKPDPDFYGISSPPTPPPICSQWEMAKAVEKSIVNRKLETIQRMPWWHCLGITDLDLETSCFTILRASRKRRLRIIDNSPRPRLKNQKRKRAFPT